jgi:acyl-CoA-binding protein
MSLTDFSVAVEGVKNLTNLSNENKLAFYGLYKQAVIGPCKTSAPWFDPVGQAKHAAWLKLGTMTKKQACEDYYQLFLKLKK